MSGLRAAEPRDADAVERLLAAADLPLDGAAAALAHAVVAERDGALVGVAALELHGGSALLRSVVVEPSAQGDGLGGRLVAERLAQAAALGVDDVYLLTTTAEAFFACRGFARVERERVPDAIRASPEFASLCPASAAVMRRAVAQG